MGLKDCIAFATENRNCSIATMDGDQPRVRIFALWFADETGFYFSTGAAKPACRQLKANPRTELCFFSLDAMRMLRVTGEVEFLEDIPLKTRLLEDMPFLKEMGVTGPEDRSIAVFRVARGEAYFWSMGENMRESVSAPIRFGLP